MIHRYVEEAGLCVRGAAAARFEELFRGDVYGDSVYAPATREEFLSAEDEPAEAESAEDESAEDEGEESDE